MKKIKFGSQFPKHFKDRISSDKNLVKDYKEAVAAFLEDPQSVDDHELEGKMFGKRAFAVADDCRVVYIEHEDSYVFIDIGTHEQVYVR